jgi:hypothetical protein
MASPNKNPRIKTILESLAAMQALRKRSLKRMEKPPTPTLPANQTRIKGRKA